MDEDKYKKRHIGKFKGCLHKINELKSKFSFDELIKRELILKEKYKYKNGKICKDKDYVSKETIENEERRVINQIKWQERHKREYKIYKENIISGREELREWYLKKVQEDADKINILRKKLNLKN